MFFLYVFRTILENLVNSVFVSGLGEAHLCDMNLSPSAFLSCHTQLQYMDKNKQKLDATHFYTQYTFFMVSQGLWPDS